MLKHKSKLHGIEYIEFVFAAQQVIIKIYLGVEIKFPNVPCSIEVKTNRIKIKPG